MHRLRSKSAIYRFRIAAFLLCAKCVLFPVCAGLLAYSMMINDLDLTWIAIGLTAAAMLIIFFQWLAAQRTNCPLCITPVLAGRNCAKNRHSRKLFGSHRLRVACAILFRNSFRCQYCNEPTTLEVRRRLRNTPDSRG